MKYKWESIPRNNIELVVLKEKPCEKGSWAKNTSRPDFKTERGFGLLKGFVAVVLALGLSADWSTISL